MNITHQFQILNIQINFQLQLSDLNQLNCFKIIQTQIYQTKTIYDYQQVYTKIFKHSEYKTHSTIITGELNTTISFTG